ncbi:Ig-like domain-containing protein [Pseudozobellia sp. WGM2]|uniref:Ig-like domain-containing protein n=1 Tax=Pseudozobellia sp. WGM2 TaxID=2787625 RepID=UPI001AE0E042|nr:Ig-like domain-containing protein [Pseudozobellia sp. WGM2]
MTYTLTTPFRERFLLLLCIFLISSVRIYGQISVTGVEVTPDMGTVSEGGTLQLTATVDPSDADDPGVAWSSSDESIATVDATGLVTTIVPGTATITATTNDGGFTASSIITVESAPVPVTGVTVTPDMGTVTEGETLQLSAVVEPSDADDPSVVWSSSDESVATVDSTGLVTTIVPGTATITATTNDGGFTAGSIITVEAAPVPVTGITVTPESSTVTEGGTLQLTATVVPSDADDPSVAWSSSNVGIAMVDSLGVVTAISSGTVTITATTDDGGFVDSSEITIKPPLNHVGQWSEPIPFGIVPVAVANLPDGRLVTWSSKYKDYFGGADGFTYTELFDPYIGANGMALGEKITPTNHDMFCPGINNLGNGQLLVTGGSSNAKSTLYDYSTDNWIATDNMNVGRGYHSGVTLSDGSAFVIGGSWSGGLAPSGEKIGEIWRQERGWKTLPGLRSDLLFNTSDLAFEQEGVYRVDNHAWLWAAPNGKVFHAGPGEEMHWIDVNGSGSYSYVGNRADDTYSMKGTTVMFDIGKILKVGGATSYASGDLAKDNSYVIDINDENNVTVSPTQNKLSFSRTMHNSVVLPNGEVLVTGGLNSARVFTDYGARLDAEIYNPSTNLWRTVVGMSVPRTYHSVSILMSDGKVFVGGGGLCTTCDNHLNAEIYSPPYLYDDSGNLAERPVIEAPEEVDYNSSMTVTGSPGIVDFNLIRMSSSTHSTNNEQRRVPLAFSGNGTYTLAIPDRNIMPPGYYMLFALNADGVPSVSEPVLVGMPVVLASGVLLSHEVFELNSGETAQLIATVVPENTENKKVIWSSNNPAIATVSENGEVTAHSMGTAIITATTEDGGFTAKSNIVVDGGCSFSNIALGAIANQSSTYGNGVAATAIDGVTSGNSPWIPNVQHTANEFSPWWELDLGSTYLMDTLSIYNRGEGLEIRLKDFYVFVSEKPFPSTATVESLSDDSSLSSYFFEGEAGLLEKIALNKDGRYVRIQLSGGGILHMAEVEIQGCFLGSPLCEGVPPPEISAVEPLIESDDVQNLVAYPEGGTWSGASSDGTFNPSIGPGTYEVTYTYDNGEGCVQSHSIDIVVNSACFGIDPPTIISSGPYLDTDGIQILDAFPAGGTWSGASTDGTFDPSLGEGIYSVTYTYDNGSGCIQTETGEIRVNTLGSRGCVLSNIALAGEASQSSTYGNGVAQLAVDGNTEGSSPWTADLQHTNNENKPWWQVDLGSNSAIEEIHIYNRQGFEFRLKDFYIFISNEPFEISDTLESLLTDSSVTNFYFNGEASIEEIIPFDKEGRYVRIQLSGNNTLHMAEVEIMGCLLDAEACTDADPIVIENYGPFTSGQSLQNLIATPEGGTWSGVTTDGTFDPLIGEGIYEATYTHDNGEGCLQSQTVSISVNGPCFGTEPITFTDYGPFLDTDGVQTVIANPIGGSWSGAITDGTFDPSIGAGSYEAIYAFDNGEGCIQTETLEIIVNTLSNRGCILQNLALTGLAAQSSTYGNGAASLAHDGNLEGSSAWSADLQHTNNEYRPWWQIDLGTKAAIDELKIYNRQGLEFRLNNFYIFLSDYPISSSATIESLQNDSDVVNFFFGGEADTQENIFVNGEGRYVRIQLSGSGILHLPEVQVMGCTVDESSCENEPPLTLEEYGPYTTEDEVQILSASPTGGVWSGATTDGTFDPSIGPGIYEITYSYDNGLGCYQSKSINIEVNIIGNSGCVLSNGALSKNVLQSSTYGNGLATYAVDGNLQGSSPWTADLQHTTNEFRPWWQVDLGEVREIEEVKIYNRSDGLQFKLKDFYVFVSQEPITAANSLENLISDENVENYFFAGEAELIEVIKILDFGRYLRIQLSGSGTLHMAEVEVMGCSLSGNGNALKVSPENLSRINRFDELKSVELVPNPTTDYVHINVLSDENITRILVFDMEGRQVLSKKPIRDSVDGNVETIDVSYFTKGVYQIMIFLDNGDIVNRNLIKN